MGAPEAPADYSGAGEFPETDPGSEHAGRHMGHQPGECEVADGVLPECLAIRHGSH
ncbi:hypothetical protein D3C73_1331520 [compost metagenome]